jgi:hypothetical protein
LNVWRTDLEEFLPLDVVEACTDWRVYERAPQPGVRYFAFGDSAGGTGKDSYAFALLHIDPDGVVVVDVIREWKPRFVPAQVIGEIVGLCQAYGVREVYGDNAGAGFHLEDWRTHPVAYKKWKDTTSENYLTALPSFLSRRVRILDNMTARNQLTSLERRPGAGDKENVSHPEHGGAHDDVAAAICGAIALAQQVTRWAADTPNIHVPFVAGTPRSIPGADPVVVGEVVCPPGPNPWPSAPAAAAPAAPAPEPWQAWIDAGGYGGPGFDRWSNRG